MVSGGSRYGAGRPTKGDDEERSVPRSFSLPESENEALADLARSLRLSVSATIRRAVQELAERCKSVPQKMPRNAPAGVGKKARRVTRK
jgi:hypothetical protein